MSKEMVESLNLTPFREAKVSEAGNVRVTQLYKVDIELSSSIKFSDVVADQSNIGDKFDAIIGMSILSKGNLSIKNEGDRTVLEFDVIDVQEGETS